MIVPVIGDFNRAAHVAVMSSRGDADAVAGLLGELGHRCRTVALEER